MNKRTILWTAHAQDKYTERILICGLSREEIEEIVRNQQVKTMQCYHEKSRKTKVETVGKAANRYFTIQKIEGNKEIVIITLWESSPKEVEKWHSAQ